jgi:HAD superfamily hydrolase (TIGR01490 family)
MWACYLIHIMANGRDTSVPSERGRNRSQLQHVAANRETRNDGAVSTRRAALFDMDRTLVRIDTATLYVRYQRDVGEATWVDAVRVAWWMLQYTLGVVDAGRVAEQALRSFRGRREAWLQDTCNVWFTDYVLSHVADAGRSAVARHIDEGDLVAIVTGGTPYAALPLARELGIAHVAATHLEVDDGFFTGRVKKPMGYGPGKVVLAERLAAEQGFSLPESTFYSDSITDLPLLERVKTPVVVNPDRRLRRVADKRGWRVESW